MTPQLYVATNGLSVWSSRDLGETISRMPSSTGMYSGSQVWALAVHPSAPGVLLAGTDSGVYRLDAAAQRWTHLSSAMDDMLVTALAFSPDNRRHSRRHAAFGDISISRRRRDLDRHRNRNEAVRGQRFLSGRRSECSSRKAPSKVRHWTRVTQITFDTEDPDLVGRRRDRRRLAQP
jgi:hypothetical protein